MCSCVSSLASLVCVLPCYAPVHSLSCPDSQCQNPQTRLFRRAFALSPPLFRLCRRDFRSLHRVSRLLGSALRQVGCILPSKFMNSNAVARTLPHKNPTPSRIRRPRIEQNPESKAFRQEIKAVARVLPSQIRDAKAFPREISSVGRILPRMFPATKGRFQSNPSQKIPAPLQKPNPANISLQPSFRPRHAPTQEQDQKHKASNNSRHISLTGSREIARVVL